jgi:hypothetical protein
MAWVDRPDTERINEAFAAIRDEGFLGSNKMGGVGYIYENILSQKLTAKTPVELQAINDRLKLGTSITVTSSGKLRRRSVRAVLLAATLMWRDSVEASVYLKRYKDMSLEALRNSFYNMFPLSDNATIRAQWDSSNFTRPNQVSHQFAQPKDWSREIVPVFRFMVHCIARDDPMSWPGKDNPVAELSKYDLTSMTLLDSTKRYTYFNKGGFIFAVPRNNILVTYAHDLMSDTHAGPRADASHQLNLANEAKTLHFGTGGLKTPDEVVDAQSSAGAYGIVSSAYNEIAICGRPGTPLPWGMTGILECRAVFSLVPKSGVVHPNSLAETAQRGWAQIAERLGIPMLYIPMMV